MHAERVAQRVDDGPREVESVLDDGREPSSRPFLIPRLGASTILLGVILLLAAEAIAAGFDADVALHVADLPRWQVRVWAFITEFGTSGYMFTVSAAVASAAWIARGRFEDAGRRMRSAIVMKAALYFFGCIATSGIAAQAVKHLVGRMRPKFLTQNGAFDFLGATLHRGADSFPSGHTTSAFAAAVALGLLAPRVRLPLILFACLIGISRIGTGNHFPSDVLAGAALGASASWGLAVFLARRNVLFRRSGPIADA